MRLSSCLEIENICHKPRPSRCGVAGMTDKIGMPASPRRFAPARHACLASRTTRLSQDWARVGMLAAHTPSRRRIKPNGNLRCSQQDLCVTS